jgi:WD40 repeat protein
MRTVWARVITLILILLCEHAVFSTDTKNTGLKVVHVWTRLGDTSGKVDSDNDTASVESVEFSPNGRLVVSGSKGQMIDGKRVGQAVKLWRVSDGRELWSRPRVDEVEAVSFTPDGRFIVAGGEDNKIEILRVRDGVVIKTLSLKASCDGLRFTHSGKFLAVGDEAQQISIYKVSNWTIQHVIRHGGSGEMAVNSIDFTRDDKIMVSGGSNGEVKIWSFDASKGQLDLMKTLTNEAAVKSVRISPNGELIAAGLGMGLGVKIWSVKDGKHIATLKLLTSDPLTMEAVEWTPDGKYLVTGGTEGRIADGIGHIRFYKTSNLGSQKTEPVLMEKVFRQEYFHFTRNGKLMVSGHEDGTLRTWKIIK